MAKNIHIIGIGGIGTSSLGQILNEKGNNISGSDYKKSELINIMVEKGIKINIGHKQKNIDKKTDLVIYSPAIEPENEELKYAKELNIKTLSYPEALGEFSKEYYTIAIAGTHGKSTTASMLSVIMNNASLDPTVVVGTKIKQISNKNYQTGKSKYLVIEACEYKRSFLNFNPDLLLITNIELDHLDYYKDLKDYTNAFEQLAKQSKKIIMSSENILTNKIEKNNSILWSQDEKNNIKIDMPGEHNKENAINAKKAALELGISESEIDISLKTFEGTWRRMEEKETSFNNTVFIDDYAHHPTEIKATLNAVSEKYIGKKILVIFQPHQYSRTAEFLDEFSKSFWGASKVIIPNIYKVRDSKEDQQKISVDILVNKINKEKVNAMNGISLANTAEIIKKEYQKYDVVITMGAGDISSIYELF